MIKGLETYTVRSGIIYLNSLLRSSILYAAETYYNLSERNLRMLEIIEEDCLRKLLETGSECPIALLYLETGQLPARFHYQIMMLNFLKYILQQDLNSLISKFFRAQNEHPTNSDWVSNVKKILLSIKLYMTFEDIKFMKMNQFKKIVENKVRKAAFTYFLAKIKSKGKEMIYGSSLQCQTYLCHNNLLTLYEQRAIFS